MSDQQGQQEAWGAKDTLDTVSSAGSWGQVRAQPQSTGELRSPGLKLSVGTKANRVAVCEQASPRMEHKGCCLRTEELQQRGPCWPVQGAPAHGFPQRGLLSLPTGQG